jgi:hypothetical protein
MEIEPVDERDSGWEDDSPRFRVYFFGGGHPHYPPGGYGVATYDVTDADVLETVAWATERAGTTKLFSVALVSDDQRGVRGLTWLVGVDMNGRSEFEKHRDAMLAREARSPDGPS